MPVEITVPPLGESLVDAVVGQWLKAEGDAVSRGETLLELETDKVNLDVAATEDGVLSNIARSEGDVVVVGEVLGLIAEGASTVKSNGSDAPPSDPPAQPEPPAPVESPAETPEIPAVDAAGRAAPAVRRLAEEHNVQLSSIAGTGPGGRVTREDVLAAASPAPPAQLPDSAAKPQAAQTTKPAETPGTRPDVSGRPEERVRMSRRRQTIASRLLEAQHSAAMLTTFNEIDMTAVMELRTARKDAFKERHGVGLGFMSFFTKAAIGALKAFPNVNAEIQGNEIVYKKYYDIGIAVGVDEGLVVPIIRDADKLNFAQIEKEIVDLATRARDGSLTLPELTGGTFTITNGGVYGSLMSTPILNAPQVGILGMHTIQKRPVAIADEIVIRPMMYVALSYDHRIVDGSDAVRFLVRIKELVEDPTSLLLEG